MRLRRQQRPTDGNGLLDDDRSPMAEVIGTTFARDVDDLVARLAELDARMSGLERRLRDANDAAVLLPDQTDVLDARIRSARVAADLHLVAIELKSELQRLRSGLDERSDDVLALADQLVELTTD